MKRICLAFLIVGCDMRSAPQPDYLYDCDAEKLSKWVLECIEKANPQADEEPEDWVSQCERTGKHILCEEAPAVRYQPCGGCGRHTLRCSEVTDPDLKAVCTTHHPKESS